jgi:hypothetical protein
MHAKEDWVNLSHLRRYNNKRKRKTLGPAWELRLNHFPSLGWYFFCCAQGNQPKFHRDLIKVFFPILEKIPVGMDITG